MIRALLVLVGLLPAAVLAQENKNDYFHIISPIVIGSRQYFFYAGHHLDSAHYTQLYCAKDESPERFSSMIAIYLNASARPLKEVYAGAKRSYETRKRQGDIIAYHLSEFSSVDGYMADALTSKPQAGSGDFDGSEILEWSASRLKMCTDKQGRPWVLAFDFICRTSLPAREEQDFINRLQPRQQEYRDILSSFVLPVIEPGN